MLCMMPNPPLCLIVGPHLQHQITVQDPLVEQAVASGAVAYIRNQELHCLYPQSHVKHQQTKTCLFARAVPQHLLYLTNENKLLSTFQGKSTIQCAQSWISNPLSLTITVFWVRSLNFFHRRCPSSAVVINLQITSSMHGLHERVKGPLLECYWMSSMIWTGVTCGSY